MNERKLELYKQWAPDESPWSAWAKPVLFASMDEYDLTARYTVELLPAIDWANRLDKSTAIIIDLPGEQAILEALALAQKGYRPVPLFNGCKAPGMLIDVSQLTNTLGPGAELLAKCSITYDAPPVFILDSRRMDHSGQTNAGRYDNRWCVVPQDMPSGKYLLEAGIMKVVLRSHRVQEDLAHILCRYKETTLKLQMVKEDNTIEDLIVRPPSLFRSLSYRWSALWGLKRNSTGGFGAPIPLPPEPTTTGGYRSGGFRPGMG